MKKIFALFYCSLMVFVMTSCGSSKVSAPVSPKMVNLALVSVPQTNKYVNLEYGIRLNVKDGRETLKSFRSTMRVLSMFRAFHLILK